MPKTPRGRDVFGDKIVIPKRTPDPITPLFDGRMPPTPTPEPLIGPLFQAQARGGRPNRGAGVGLPMDSSNTVAPSIDDTTPNVGQTLTGDVGTWTPTPTSYTYQWYADGVAISGATDATFVVTPDEFGAVLTFGVTPVDPSGDAAISDATTAVAWTGLGLWLDSSDATTLFQDSAGTTPAVANNDVIGRWADKSGNALHATQATTANKPLLKTAAQNSLVTIAFAGTDDSLTCGDVLDLGTNNALLFMVAKKTGTGATNETYIAKQAAAAGRYLLIYEGGSIKAGYQNAAGTQIVSVTRTGGSYEITGMRLNRTSSGTLRAYANGAQIGSDTTFTPESTNHNIAAELVLGILPPGGYPLTGNIAEVILVLRAAEFTDDEVTVIASYLNDKWAVY